jgi:DNA-binding CsgD family transcriptional regulator
VVGPALGHAAARELLPRRGTRQIPAGVAAGLCAATSGNPLALLELPALVSAEQLEGRAPLDDPLPLGPSLERAYRSRLDELPDPVRRAATVAAASETGSVDEIERALQQLRLNVEDLEALEHAGLVTLSAGRLEFSHPLLRSAAYHMASGAGRRASHRALAAALTEAHDLARRAWHRGLASPGADEEVARELEEAASEAATMGAPAGAASALQAAARLSASPGERVRRVQEAGLHAYLAGQLDVAARLLAEARESVADPCLAARIDHLRGLVEMFTGCPGTARHLMTAAAEVFETTDPSLAALALADAAGTYTIEARATRALAVAERAYELGRTTGGLPARAATVIAASAAILCGDSARGRELLAECRPLEGGDARAHPWLAAQTACCLAWLDEDGTAHDLISRIVARHRGASAVGFLPFALAIQCEIEFRVGNWAVAYAAGCESVALAEQTGQRHELAYSRAQLARVGAAYGRQAECRANAQQALATAGETGAGAVGHHAAAALGLLELGNDHPEEAAAHFDRSAGFPEGVRQPTVVRSQADAVEAHLRAEHRAEAERLLAVLAEEAELTGSPWAAAVTARCRGLLASETAFEEHFEASLAAHERLPAPFDTARTRLSFGERLRRARRRAQARQQLRAALAAFDRLGAAPWAERARRELEAAGHRTPGTAAASPESLMTAHELQVALKVAEGATTKEVAAALFISPRTVDAHLHRIYRKLAIRSRSELTRLVVEHRLLPAEPD